MNTRLAERSCMCFPLHTLTSLSAPSHSLPLLKNLVGTSTYLLLKNSAQFFPKKSILLVLVTPLSSRFLNRKWTPFKFGNSNLSISIFGRRDWSYSLPNSSLMVSMVRTLRSQMYSSACRTQNPQLQSEPLSPERALTTTPSGTRSVAP